MRVLKVLRTALPVALPIMLGYVAIGIPCGVMAAEVGVGPAAAFLVSATFYSGAGQFMMSSLALAGTPVASMVASVALVSTRQLLYSAALAPYLARAPKPLAALFAATVTDESFGVNLDRLQRRSTLRACSRGRRQMRSVRRWARRLPSQRRSCLLP